MDALDFYLGYWQVRPKVDVSYKLLYFVIREYGSSTLYVGLSRFPHRANTNHFRCNSLASEHFHPKF